MCSSVCRSIGVCPNFLKGRGSYTSKLLSEHLFSYLFQLYEQANPLYSFISFSPFLSLSLSISVSLFLSHFRYFADFAKAVLFFHNFFMCARRPKYIYFKIWFCTEQRRGVEKSETNGHAEEVEEEGVEQARRLVCQLSLTGHFRPFYTITGRARVARFQKMARTEIG